MILLVIGVLAFAILHLVPVVPSAKAKLKARFGERRYGMMFGVGSVLTLILVIAGWQLSDFVDVYEPPVGGRYVTYLLVAIGFVFLGIFIFRGRLRQILRFPLAFGVIAWATGHLFANGDLASLILFVGLLIYAVLHIILGFSNGVRPSPEVRQGHDVISVLIGLALFGVMTQMHPYLIGVPVIQLTR